MWNIKCLVLSLGKPPERYLLKDLNGLQGRTEDVGNNGLQTTWKPNTEEADQKGNGQSLNVHRQKGQGGAAQMIWGEKQLQQLRNLGRDLTLDGLSESGFN